MVLLASGECLCSIVSRWVINEPVMYCIRPGSARLTRNVCSGMEKVYNVGSGRQVRWGNVHVTNPIQHIEKIKFCER